MPNLKHNFWQLLICLDQLLLCLICLCTGTKGWADMTLSAQAHVWHKQGVRSWPKTTIDTLIFWEKNHCEANKSGEAGKIEEKTQLIPFERTRRITGYLVGDTSRFCNAKAREEQDRVKHGMASMADNEEKA